MYSLEGLTLSVIKDCLEQGIDNGKKMFSSRTNFPSLKAGLLDKEQLSSELNDMDSDEDLDEVEPTDIEVLQDSNDDYESRLHPATK